MMNRRIWLPLGIVLLCLPPGSPAQAPRRPQSGPSPSHHPLPDDVPDLANIESMLNERLDQAAQKGKISDLQSLLKDKDKIKELTKGQLTPEQLKVLDGIDSDKWNEILRDPQFRSLLDQAIAANKRKQGGGELTKDQISSLKSLAEANGDPSKLRRQQAPSGPPAGNPGPGQAQPPQAESTPSTSTPQGNPAFVPPSEEGETWWERWANSFTGYVMDEVNNPDNAGALQRALRSLGGLKEGSDGSEHFDFAGIWKSATEDAATWMMSRWEWPRRAADAPGGGMLNNVRESVPNVGESMSGAISRISVGRPSPPGGFDSRITQVAWVLFAAAMAAIGWNLMAKRRGAGGRGGNSGVGPWPVAPSAVASRDDLIRAFEYLAQLRLGAAGRTSNHLAVASRLNEGESDYSRRAAAGELARLYERARYEPDPGPLADVDLAAARRDLTLLAGVAAA